MGLGTSQSSTEPAAALASLDAAIAASLDALLAALELQPLGDDRFRAPAEAGRFDRIFGGQVLAQALLAAGATVSAKHPHSLHAYFVEGGRPGEPVEIAVDRVRDGRSFSTRRVSVRQAERELVVAIASFHSETGGAALPDGPPPAPGPEELPRLQDWVSDFSPARRLFGLSWIEQPPPVELRIGEPPNFMGGPSAQDARVHWMRLPRPVASDPLLHAALVTYASDYLLLDMIPRARLRPAATTSFVGFSLDHSIWFHRPIRLDGWHRYSQQTEALAGDRGLVRGAIHDSEGLLVASVTQEGLVRAPAPTGQPS